MSLRPRPRARALLLGLACPLLACDPPERSDKGQYELEISLGDRLGVDSRRVLVGTEFSVELTGPRGSQCVQQSASGSLAEVESGRFVAQSPGPGAVELTVGDGCPSEPFAATPC